jgi:hypothetical protein
MRSPVVSARVRGPGVVTFLLAAGLLAGSVVFARQFHATAVREFRFPWGTWGAAVLLALAAGATVGGSVAGRAGRSVLGLAVAVAAVVLAHLPAVLVAGPGWRRWPGLATTTVLDRTGPQLLAAAVIGAAVAALITRAPVRARHRDDRADGRAIG